MVALQVGRTFESVILLILHVLPAKSLVEIVRNAAVMTVKFWRGEFL